MAFRTARTGSIHINDGRMRAGEDAVKRVKVGLGNGVKLVVMAAGAGNGERLKCLGDGVDLVVGEGDHFIERIDR